MSPRAVDWSLAFVVWALLATGVLSLYVTRESEAWIFLAHGVLGFALVALLVWKLRRVWSRLLAPDAGTWFGVLSLAAVLVALASGFIWSAGGEINAWGYNLMGWHMILGSALVLVVLFHAIVRRKPLRRRDVRGRREFLVGGGVAVGAFALWQLQAPLFGLLGFRGADRRFTGSYELGSFGGNGSFPPTSWVADSPRALDSPEYRVRVDGLVSRVLSLASEDLDGGDEAEALLDCTSGWYTRQRWSGVELKRVLDRAGVDDGARYVVVHSHTGYRWSFPIKEADDLLLATGVGGEPLTHGHGAPVRLVAPGRRGFQWVKWVVRLELREDDDLAAPASTVWSSVTAAGRGET